MGIHQSLFQKIYTGYLYVLKSELHKSPLIQQTFMIFLVT